MHDGGMTFELTPDSIASDMIRRARMDTGDPINLEALAHRLGQRVVIGAHRSVHGACVSGEILTDGSRDILAHELAHLAWRLAGLPSPSDERFVIAIAAALVVPRLAFDRGVRAGATIAELADRFHVQETCSALRLGETSGEPIGVWCGRGRMLARGDWHYPSEVIERMVRQRHHALRVSRLTDRSGRLLVRLAGR